MDRKEFLKKSSWLSTGIILSPALLTQCSGTQHIVDTKFNGKVLVIGAGVSGLSAAKTLLDNGIDFTVLEASNRIGGRVKKIEGFADYDIDLGAEWLHGGKSQIAAMVDASGHETFKDKSDEYFWFQNQITENLPIDIFSPLEEDGLPDISIRAYAQQQGWGDEYLYILQALTSSNGTDIDRLSAYWNVKEFEDWSSGNTDYKFKRTYFDFINEEIASHVKSQVKLNAPVTEIDYSGSTIMVKCPDQTYEADKVIITVPIPILKDGDIEFFPTLPVSKTNAFQKIGMDAGMKVYLKFSQKFYEENVAGGKICAAYADESYGRNSNDHVLLGFVMGSQAEYLDSLNSDDAIIEALLNDLDEIYDNKATPNFIKGHVQNWFREPYVRGAYSYSSLGIGNSREIAAKTVDQKLYFAGEAMNMKGHFQTVQGAAEVGIEKVLEILEEVN